jgi:hypothetical protein
LNKRLPRLTCSGVKTVVLPEESVVTVLVASSKSMADALTTKRLKIQNRIQAQNFEYVLNIK